MLWHSLRPAKCKPLGMVEVQWILGIADSCKTNDQKLIWARFIRKQMPRLERQSVGYSLLHAKRRELHDTLETKQPGKFTGYSVSGMSTDYIKGFV